MKTLFQTMRIFKPESVRVVADVEWEVTPDYVQADLIEVEVGEEETVNHPVNIKHKDFLSWLDKNEYLEWESNTSDIVTGEHVQTTGKIGYIDFIKNNLTAEIIHEFLFETGRTELAFDKTQI